MAFNDLVLQLPGVNQLDQLEVTNSASPSRYFETSCPTVVDRTISTSLALGGPGRYTVTWRIVSADGHPVTNSIHFNFAPPPGYVADSKGSLAPKCGEAQNIQASQPTGAQTPNAQSASSSIVWVIASFAAAILLMGAALLVFGRNPQKS